MLTLNEFIGAVTIGTKAHVCIADLSGFTRHEPFVVSGSCKIHDTPFCNAAKGLPNGLKRCMRCRNRSDVKALCEQKPFVGTCICGVTEIAVPLVFKDCVQGIVYVGALMKNRAFVQERVLVSARRRRAMPQPLLNAIDTLQPCESLDSYRALAQAIADYIVLLFQTTPPTCTTQPRHEVVQAAVEWVNASFRKDIDLTPIADRYGLNPQYCGRLFKEQVGESFHSYLNRTRLHHAKKLLAETNASVIEIALDAGYNTVTYFNRVFKAATGLSPREYRQKTSHRT